VGSEAGLVGSSVESFPQQGDLSEVERLCDQGAFLRARDRVERFAPVESWPAIEARLVGARVLRHLGALGRATRIEVKAFRDHPTQPLARAAYARHVLSDRGPLETLDLLKDPSDHVELICLRGQAYALLRDTERANAELERLHARDRMDQLAVTTRMLILARADDWRGARRLAEQSTLSGPVNRLIHQTAGDVLCRTGAIEKAISLLQQLPPESSEVLFQLASLLHETRRFEDERKVLDRCAELPTKRTERANDRLFAYQIRCANARGDRRGALENARRIRSTSMDRFVERLEAAPATARRKELDVPFVQQMQMTCVPAVLTSIAAYFGIRVDHDEVTRAICYAGTPSPRHRSWGEANGFRVREFSVDWQTALALIEREVPFALLLRMPGSGHVHIATGFDENTRSVIVRDPSTPLRLELDADHLVDEGRGRHAFVMVPKDREHLLGSVALADEAIYDELYAFDQALDDHDRERAARLVQDMTSARPAHFITLRARQSLAMYDGNGAEVLRVCQELVGSFPESVTHRVSMLGAMKARCSNVEVLQAVKELSQRAHGDPSVASFLAMELSADARNDVEVGRLHRSMRRRYWEMPTSVATLAQFELARQNRDVALELSRYAACLEGTNDRAAYNYFVCAATMGKVNDGLALLKSRVQTLGSQSGAPAATLAAALELLERPHEARTLVGDSLAQRPQDVDLLTKAALLEASFGDPAKAQDVMQRATARMPLTRWLRTMARVEECAGQPEAAQRLWHRAAKLAPDDPEIEQAILRLIAARDGLDAAIRHVVERHERCSAHPGLTRLRIEWERAGSGDRGEATLRKLVDSGAADSHIHRDLAFLLLETRTDRSELHKLADVAQQLDPGAPDTLRLQAALDLAEGNRPRAIERLARAVSTAPDHPSALGEYLNAIPTLAERRDHLRLVLERILPTALSAAGLASWFEVARADLSEEEIRSALVTLRAALPGPTVWLISIRHLLLQDRWKEAELMADEAEGRFPWNGPLQVEQGLIAERQGNIDEAIDRYRRALSLDPGDSRAARQWAAAAHRKGQIAEVVGEIAKAVERAPLKLELRLALADLHDSNDDRTSASRVCRDTIKIDPAHGGAWGHLCRFEGATSFEDVLTMVRAELEARPWNPGPALAAAETLRNQGRQQEALALVDGVRSAAPRSVELHDFLAIILAQAKRFDEALAASHPPAFGQDVPYLLAARRAWVLGESGKVDAGIEAMREIVSNHPGYVWGIVHLAGWLESKGKTDEQLDLARRVALLASDSAPALTWAAQVELSNGDSGAAKVLFRRALRADAGSVQASLQLTSLLLDDGDPVEAKQTLQPISKLKIAAIEAVSLRLALLKEDTQEAAQCFARICRFRGAMLVSYAHRLLVLGGHADLAWRQIEEALSSAEATAEVGAVWVRILRASNPARLGGLYRLDPGLPATVGAVRETFSGLLTDKRRAKVRWIVLSRWSWLRRSVETWGIGAGSLTEMGDHTLATVWGASWRRFGDAKPWMLRNVAVSMRARGLSALAIPIERHAAELALDASSGRHRVWAAFEEATRGRFELAHQYKGALAEGYAQYPLVEFVRKFTNILVKTSTMPPAEGYQEARLELGAMFPSRRKIQLFTQLDRAYVKTARAIARRSGSVGAWCWANSYRLIVVSALALLALFTYDQPAVGGALALAVLVLATLGILGVLLVRAIGIWPVYVLAVVAIAGAWAAGAPVTLSPIFVILLFFLGRSKRRAR
jgi:tetratricopeptide (TPR) repeat protein